MSAMHTVGVPSSPSYVIATSHHEGICNIQTILYMTFRKIAQNLPFSEELLQIYEVVARLSQCFFFFFICLPIDLEKDLVTSCRRAEVSGKSRLSWARRHIPGIKKGQ
jgi:hypothetical protein